MKERRNPDRRKTDRRKKAGSYQGTERRKGPIRKSDRRATK